MAAEATDRGETLRESRPEDIGPLKELIDRTIDSAYPGAYCPSAIEWFKAYHSPRTILEHAEKGLTLVIEREGRLIATGTLVGTEVTRVFVAPEHQRGRLGMRIVEAMERRAAELGLPFLELYSSTVARPFYDRLGYACIEIGALEMSDGGRLDYHRMRKVLRAQCATR